MKVADFNTVELANAHEEVITRMISNSTMRLYLKATGLFLLIHEIAEGKHDTTEPVANHEAKELCLLITKSLEGSSTDDNDFNFIVGNSKGDAIIADTTSLQTMIPTHEGVIEALLGLCISHCNITTKPFENITQIEFEAAKAELVLVGEEELLLPNSTIQKVYNLNIINTAPKATTIKIMQRFGSSESDLTPWHQAGQFSNVHYKQQTYKAQIGTCSCSYRELKVVSEYLLDMSIS